MQVKYQTSASEPCLLYQVPKPVAARLFPAVLGKFSRLTPSSCENHTRL